MKESYPSLAEISAAPERVNKHYEIVSFSDTETGGGSSALVYDARSCDRVSFKYGRGMTRYEAGDKYIRPPLKGAQCTYLVVTESGNHYIVRDGMIINGKNEHGYVIPDGNTDYIPDVVFGEKWGVPGLFNTTRVVSVLEEYTGNAIGREIDMPSPFTEAKRITELKREALEERGTY